MKSRAAVDDRVGGRARLVGAHTRSERGVPSVVMPMNGSSKVALERGEVLAVDVGMTAM